MQYFSKIEFTSLLKQEMDMCVFTVSARCWLQRVLLTLMLQEAKLAITK